MIDVLQALQEEMIIEKVMIAKEMEMNHRELYRYILETFRPQIVEMVPNEKLKEEAVRTKAFVRTGENIVFSNIIIQAGFSSE